MFKTITCCNHFLPFCSTSTIVNRPYKKLKRFCQYSKSINGTQNNMVFTVKLATIEEEDAVDIYYEILCNDEDEDKDTEITFQLCLAIGMELLK